MSNKLISQISDPFSTGGGGINFENQIQAMFLLSLIIDGFCPVMTEKTKRVCFQAKRLNINTDDLVVYTYRGQNEGKLLCQIKHKTVVGANNNIFKSVICAAWEDFNNENLDKERDRIALITANISASALSSFQFIHQQALYAVDEKDFFNRIETPAFSNLKNSEKIEIVKKCISMNNNIALRDFDIWRFFKVFTILLVDLDYEDSIIRSLSTSLINCNSSMDARLVWSKLVEYTSKCDQNGASINKENFDEYIMSIFSKKEKQLQIPPLPISIIDSFVPTVVLIGSWKESNKYDHAIIEEISGMKYLEFEGKARSMLFQNPNYVQLENGCWTIVHKEELLAQCKDLIFENYLNRLFDATIKVLRQNSKRVISNNPYYISSGDEYDNSTALRSSLVDSCCLLKKLNGIFSHCGSSKIEAGLGKVVNSLLNKADWTTWANLNDCLESLAEISPIVYLNKIECNILNKKQDVIDLFPKQNQDLFFSTNYISSLILSLMILAWSPDYLIRTITILGLLESLPYEKTNFGTTPLAAIISIMLPWYPQTLGDLNKRKNALKSLEKDNPEIYWQVLIRLLPNFTSATSDNPKPKYLSLVIPDKISVTYSEIYAVYDYLLESAIDLAHNQPEKQIYLVDQIRYMNKGNLTAFLKGIEDNIQSYSKNDSFLIWLHLKEQLFIINPTEKMVIFKQLDKIHNLIQSLEPDDIRIKYKELYLGNSKLLNEENNSIDWDFIENKKTESILEIYKKYGVEEVEKFGYSVKNIFDVASKLGKKLNDSELSNILELYNSDKISKEFITPLVEAFSYSNGPENIVSDTTRNMPKERQIELFSMIPFSMRLYKVINSVLEDDTEYWKTANMPYILLKDDLKEINMITNKLILSKRYVTAINLIGHSKFDGYCTVNDIFKLLTLAGTKKSSENNKLDNYAVKKIFEWLNSQNNINLNELSDLEFIYLPILIKDYGILPKVLKSRISLDADYFCSLIDLYYKKDNSIKLNNATIERLSSILINFKVVPGINLSGKFKKEKFNEWMEQVKDWSIANDKYKHAMHVVGSGLAYADLDESGLPDKAIVEELNKFENDELRRGYFLGVINKRGLYTIDSEAKPELQLAKTYSDRAEISEKEGYSRYATVLKELSEEYFKEAEKILDEYRKRSNA